MPSKLGEDQRRLSKLENMRPQEQWPQPGKRPLDPKAEDVRVFIGIHTAATSPGTEPRSKYDYNYRRELARSMWISRARRWKNIDIKFVVGINPDPEKHANILKEQAEFGDIMVLPVVDTYANLTTKSREYHALVYKMYPNVEFIVKSDDDVYLLPERLLMAADQWNAAKADWIGCFSTGPTHTDRAHRWFEPNAVQIGPKYAWRAQGCIYVLSRRVVRDIIVRRFEHLRLSGSAEDSAIGVWMLGGDAVPLEDKRLCMIVCNEASVGMCDTWDQGLQLPYWHAVHADPGCHNEPKWPLPYIKPYDGNMQHTMKILK